MTHENARAGVSKLFTAEILAIIASVCTFASVLSVGIAAAGASADSVGAGLGGVAGVFIFGLAAGVLFIIAYILQLVGLNKAGKDEPLFKSAFTIAIIGLIVSLVVSILSSVFATQSQLIGEIGQLISMVISLVITHHVLFGAANLNSELQAKAESTWKVYMATIIIYVVLSVATVILILLGFYATSGILVIVLGLLDLILTLVAFIKYVAFLNNAKKVL